MAYQAFKIFNKDEFDALDLYSKTYTLDLEGIGQKDILVTKGNLYGITYDGVFLALNQNDKNPFEFEGYAIYMDDNNDVYLGIEIEEES